MIFLLNVFSFVILQFPLNYLPYTVHDITLYTVHDVTLKYFRACKAWMHFYMYALRATNALFEIKNNFKSQKNIVSFTYEHWMLSYRNHEKKTENPRNKYDLVSESSWARIFWVNFKIHSNQISVWTLQLFPDFFTTFCRSVAWKICETSNERF